MLAMSKPQPGPVPLCAGLLPGVPVHPQMLKFLMSHKLLCLHMVRMTILSRWHLISQQWGSDKKKANADTDTLSMLPATVFS